MTAFLQHAPLGLLALLTACVVLPPPRAVMAPPIPSMLAAPGAGKDRAAFDADNRVCQRAAAQPNGDTIYAQCMISHGEVVQATPYFYRPPVRAQPYWAAPY